MKRLRLVDSLPPCEPRGFEEYLACPSLERYLVDLYVDASANALPLFYVGSDIKSEDERELHETVQHLAGEFLFAFNDGTYPPYGEYGLVIMRDWMDLAECCVSFILCSKQDFLRLSRVWGGSQGQKDASELFDVPRDEIEREARAVVADYFVRHHFGLSIHPVAKTSNLPGFLFVVAAPTDERFELPVSKMVSSLASKEEIRSILVDGPCGVVFIYDAWCNGFSVKAVRLGDLAAEARRSFPNVEERFFEDLDREAKTLIANKVA